MPKARAALCQQNKMKSAQKRGSPAGGPFVPTVTAVTEAPDLEWLVQSTDISSVESSSRPAKNKKNQQNNRTCSRRKTHKDQLSPEEEERRRIRRERNKMAAAKCRNRRRELTDSLQAETDSLEEEKAALQAEINSLMKEKEQLELLLDVHKPECKISAELQDVCEEPLKLQDVPQDPVLSPSSSPSEGLSLDKSLPPSPLELHQVPSSPHVLEPSCSIISGDSDVLLCATLEPCVEMKEVQMEELSSRMEMEDVVDDDDMDLLVPDIDLSASLGLTEWETLYMTMGGSLDPLSSPTLSPTCTSSNAVPVFDFPNPDSEDPESSKVGLTKAKAGDNSALLAL